MGNRLIGFVVCCLLLQACSSGRPMLRGESSEKIWQQRQQQLSALQHWQLKGRIGFVTAKDSGSGSLYWRQHGDDYQLKVIAPFGQGSLHINGNADGVRLSTDEGEQMHDADVERLVWQRTGWVIPVKSLRYWILGLPADIRRETVELDSSGRIASLQNRRWQVDYQRYRDADGLELPARLQLQGPDLKIKVAISDWNITLP